MAGNHSPEFPERPECKKRTRKTRSDKGSMRLTWRDRWAMPWVGTAGGIRFDHFQRLLGMNPQGRDKRRRKLSADATRKVVKRWCNKGFARFEPILAEQPGWLWLTRKGLREVGLQALHVSRPAGYFVEHQHAANYVRLRLAFDEPDADWESELEIRASMGKSVKGQKQLHVPDAWFLRSGASREPGNPVKHVAIEVEISAKSHRELFPILLWYHNQDIEIWYFGTRKAKQALLRELEDPMLRRSRPKYHFVCFEEEWHYPPPLLSPPEQ